MAFVERLAGDDASARTEKGGALRFSHYDQMIQAAVAGQGLALGRFPLVKNLLESGRLVMPLRGRYATPPGIARWLVVSPSAERRRGSENVRALDARRSRAWNTGLIRRRLHAGFGSSLADLYMLLLVRESPRRFEEHEQEQSRHRCFERQ